MKWTIATIFVVRMVSGSSHQIVSYTVCAGCVSVQSSATSLETSCFLVLRQQACHCKVRLSTTDSTGCLAHGSSCACVLHVSTYCEAAAARDGKRLTLQLARWQLNCGSTCQQVAVVLQQDGGWQCLAVMACLWCHQWTCCFQRYGPSEVCHRQGSASGPGSQVHPAVVCVSQPVTPLPPRSCATGTEILMVAVR